MIQSQTLDILSSAAYISPSTFQGNALQFEYELAERYGMTNATSALTLMDAESKSFSYRMFLNGPLIRSDSW
jgi:hypothetical protein